MQTASLSALTGHTVNAHACESPPSVYPHDKTVLVTVIRLPWPELLVLECSTEALRDGEHSQRLHELMRTAKTSLPENLKIYRAIGKVRENIRREGKGKQNGLL